METQRTLSLFSCYLPKLYIKYNSLILHKNLIYSESLPAISVSDVFSLLMPATRPFIDKFYMLNI